MQSSIPIIRDLVLIGGGHSHAIALKKWGMKPLPGVRLTLISDVFHTPYSGMLPGYIAGFYGFDQCHIDLRPLAQFAGAQLIGEGAIALDLANQRVICPDRPPIAFDVLSIDIGSTPNVLTVPGAKEYAIPVKPISQFLSHWDRLVASVTAAPQQPLSIGIVGGGTGGVELALNLQARLHHLYRSAQQPSTHLQIHLFHRGATLLEERHPWVGRRLQRILTQRGIQVYLQENVIAVESEQVRCQSGQVVRCDRLFWVTQASAASWLRASGLATDDHGFIQVNDYLQSISHPQVFAAGDIATMVRHPRPKAGVFAVRQGKPLVHNLRRILTDQPLQPFVPQREFLILIGMGDRTAIASRGALGLGPHPLLWAWKDWIDRQFMEQFAQLQPMTGRERQTAGKEAPSLAEGMRCAGCGSKVGRPILERALQRVRQDVHFHCQRDDIVIGLDDADDAAVVRVSPDQVMVQTIDYFPALIQDPFLMGQITTNHCLSDLYAMGAMPQSAMAIATLPPATDAKTEETLYQLLSGALTVLHQAQAVLIGGHTTEGAELVFGLSCNGLADPDRLLRKGGMQVDQVLLLTKALGTGCLFAADMRLKARGHWIEGAIHSMVLSNQKAMDIFQQHQATACTDITGFGLVGHVLEMVRSSGVGVELDLDAIPVLAGVQDIVRQGIVSSLYPQNVKAAAFIHNNSEVSHHPLYPVLFDPQTSGGLVATIPTARASACLAALQTNGYPDSAIIGRTHPRMGILFLRNMD